MATVRHLGLFPFCTSSFPPNSGSHIFDVGDFTQYPFTLPVSRACELWWRVKEWELSFTYARYIDLSLYSDAPPGSYAEILPTSVVLNTKDSLFSTIKGVVSNEKELVCFTENEEASQFYNWSWTAVQSFFIASDPPSSGSSVLTLQADLATNWDTQQLGFHPPFVVQQDPGQKDLWSALYVSIAQLSTLRDTDSITQGVFTIGPSGNLTQRSFNMGSAETSPGETITLSNIAVRPIEYYPYDPNDDLGPIYDSATGEQLRAFPS
jgi:hypothetical protein